MHLNCNCGKIVLSTHNYNILTLKVSIKKKNIKSIRNLRGKKERKKVKVIIKTITYIP